MRLGVVAKRTFQVSSRGVAPSDEQEPIVDEARFAVSSPDGVLMPDRLPELMPERDACDLIVLGTATSSNPTVLRRITFEAPGVQRSIQVQGDRRAELRRSGWVFTSPALWTEMALGWHRAYGGVDAGVVPAHDDPRESLRSLMIHPGAYPRNDVGRGYSLAESKLPSDGVPLPNIEDPTDLLTPERFQCAARDRWHLQPRPAGFGFLPPHWFPRSILAGTIAGRWPDSRGGLVPEEVLGILQQGLVAAQRQRSEDGPEIHPGFFQVSAPGMRARLTGTERLSLSGMRGEGTVSIELPGLPPRLLIRGPRASIEPAPTLWQVVWDVDARRLTMLWGAGVPLDSAELRGLRDEELMELPIEGT